MVCEAKVTGKGQVTIPSEIRRKLGVAEGDSLIFDARGGTVTVRAAPKESVFESGEALEIPESTRDVGRFSATCVTHHRHRGRTRTERSLLLPRPEILSAAVLLRATVPLPVDPLPDFHGKSILLSEAKQDVYVPRVQALELESTLRAAGADVKTLWLARTHAPEQAELAPVQQGLSQWESSR